MTPDPEPLTPAQRIGRTLILLVVLGAVLWATWERFTTKAGASPAEGYPEVRREVVEARPAVLWTDSIKCVGTELDPSGQLCGTIREAR